MKKAIVFILLLTTVVQYGCRKRDLQTPSYMHVAKVEQFSKPGQGTTIHDIHYVYTLINDNSIGTYLVPTTVPVLHVGAQNVEARPMIKRLAREGYYPYSMLKNYSQLLNFNELEVDTLRPVFEYHDNVDFKWMEDFDDNDASLQFRGGTFDTFYIQNDPTHSQDGSSYLYIPMGSGEQFFEIESVDLFDLPMDGREIYLEIDYKTNVPFTIGLFATSTAFVQALPTATPFATDGEWRKAYVYLTDDIFTLPDKTTRFRVFFRSANAEVANPEIFIDNIKLLFRAG